MGKGRPFDKAWKKTSPGAGGDLERGEATKAEARRWFNRGVRAGQGIEMKVWMDRRDRLVLEELARTQPLAEGK